MAHVPALAGAADAGGAPPAIRSDHMARDEFVDAFACEFCARPIPKPRTDDHEVTVCEGCMNPLLVAPDGCQALPGHDDIRHESVSESVLGRVFSAVPGFLNSLPVLPGVFQQVLALIHDPISDMDDIVSAVEKDATLTLHLIKTANSPLFRGLSPYEDARGACVRLGLREIANVVWRVQCTGAFHARRSELNRVMNELWSLSVAVGCCARGVAMLTRAHERESAFLAGLTHAVGQSLLVQILSAEPSFAVQRLSEREDRFRQMLDRHGPLMSLVVLQHWGVPAPVRAAVYCQHMARLAPNLESHQLAHTLAAGIEVARLAGFAPPGDEEMAAYQLRESCQALGLSAADMPDYAQSLRPDVEAFISSLSFD